MKKSDQLELSKIAHFLKSNERQDYKSWTDVCYNLIRRFLNDQSLMRQLQQRNTELNREINRYFSKEGDMREIIQEATRQFETSARLTKQMIKHFTPKKQRAKKTPVKKGGKR